MRNKTIPAPASAALADATPRDVHARDAAPPPARPAARGLRDALPRDDGPDWISAADIPDGFYITGIVKRTSRKYGHEEYVYTVTLPTGHTARLSLKCTEPRDDLYTAFQKDAGTPIGPCNLVAVEMKNGNAVWAFVPTSDTAQDDLPF